jgi:hypothetical protein
MRPSALVDSERAAAHDASYLAQRACDAHRTKESYQAKLSRPGLGPDA